MSVRQYPVQAAWHLGEAEIKDFSVDVSNEVQEGEAVTNLTVLVDGLPSTDPSVELTVGNPISDTTGLIWSVQLSTPTAGTYYNVTYRFQTGIGKIFDIPLLIAGVDKHK